MEKAVTKLNFAKDKVSFLNKNIDIVFIPSGHYAVPMNKTPKLLDQLVLIRIMNHRNTFDHK